MADTHISVVTTEGRAPGDAGTTFIENLELTLSSDPAAVRLTLHRLTGRLVHQGVDEDTAAKAELVLAEVLNNIVEHALSGQKGGMIRLAVRKYVGQLVFEVADDGAPMPGEVLPEGLMPEGDPTEAEIPEGGFGWPLIRQLTDEVSYERHDRRNVLRFSMALEVSAA